MPKVSCTQKLRNQLNLSIEKKNFILLVFLPFLFLLSYIVHSVSKYRRQKSYSTKAMITSNSSINDIDIICIGNIIIGGTGKSPIVRAIAQDFLEKNYIVCIASRGIGKKIKPIYVNNIDCKHINLLSDENKEHYELLNANVKRNKIFYILQNPSRSDSLKYLIQEQKKPNYTNKKFILLLDDGLQHFSCPRDINICVWDATILKESPAFSFPLGPYREGFGKEYFKKLLTTFDYRFWSRSVAINLSVYQSNISDSLKKYNLALTSNDIFISYDLIFYSIDQNDRLKKLNKETVSSQYEINEPIFVISGIANPNNFINDLKYFCNFNNIQSYFLGDHSDLSLPALNYIKRANNLFITLKDYFRWCQHPEFSIILKNKKIVLCSIEVNFYNISGEKIKFVEKLFLEKKVQNNV